LDAPYATVTVTNDRPLMVIADPCAIEDRQLALETAAFLRETCASLGLSAIYKSSFDKGNRPSLAGYRGPSLENGLTIPAEVREPIGLPVITDAQPPEQVPAVADVLQLQAFLCRQTDFIRAVAAAGKPMRIKKSQFWAPWAKAHDAGNERLVPVLATVGIAAIFLKTQLPPDNESCDGPNMVPLAKLPDLLRTLHALDRVPKETV